MTIREYRRKYRLTLKQFAKELGCSFQLLSFYETGRQPVSAIMRNHLRIVSKGQITTF